MENYEQKYKEMLERYDKILQAVKELQDANPHDEGVQNFVNDNFPELQESKDERVRKALYIYLDWLDGRKEYAPKGEYSIRDMLSWLEKQGEQKPVKKQGSCGDVCGDNRFEVIQKAKQAILKQTNIETSPDEMKVLDNFLFRCWQMDWLTKYDKQKPAEWSEEDEKIKQIALDIFDVLYADSDHNIASRDDIVQCAHWLKSLRPQNHK